MMKTLDLQQMENVQAGDLSRDCVEALIGNAAAFVIMCATGWGVISYAYSTYQMVRACRGQFA